MKVSIIVPIYNTSVYLKKCINSLVNQTHENIEILLINDGSTDDSKKIVESFKDKRIVFIDKKNEGIGKTRNLGIEKSTGDYIMFIDSDDYISIDSVKTFVDKIIKDKCDLVISDYYEDRDGQILEKRFPNFKDTNIKNSPELINDINLGPCNKIYKRELLIKNDIKFEEHLKYEDAPFVVKACLNSKKIGKVDECLSYYVIHEKSETTIRDNRIFDIIKISQIIENEFNKYDYLEIEKVNILVMILTDYTVQQRYVKSKSSRNNFIDSAFDYLYKIDYNWKKCSYLDRFSPLKRLVKTNKILTKIYCDLYRRK